MPITELENDAGITPSGAGVERPARNYFVTLATGVLVLWSAVVFSGWSAAQWFFGAAPEFGISSEPYYVFSDYASWLPLAAEVARGNLFPVEASLGTGASGLGFYPYLSIWAYGLLIRIFGLLGAGVVAQVFFPTLAFLILMQIYRQYLPLRWAAALTALGLVSFTSMPLREFLAGVISGNGWIEQGALQLPDIADFPMPAFSLVMFLLAFYFTIQKAQPTPARLASLTLLWSVQIYVHPLNALVGLPLWFTVFPLRLWRRRRQRGLRSVFRTTALQALFAVVVCLPAFFGYAKLAVATPDSLEFLGFHEQYPENLFGPFYYFAYFLVPLVLLGVIYLVKRVDPYELLMKFWPIFLVMVIEFGLVTVKMLTGKGVPPELLHSRLSLFFLHMYYYVPVLYYLNQSTYVRYTTGMESTSISSRILRSLVWFFRDASKVYIPALFVLLSFYALASAIRGFEYARDVKAPHIAEANAGLAALTEGAEPGDVLVADSATVNLMVPLAGRFGTLWVNRFANRVTDGEVLERLALWARLAGWTEDRFVAFMLPGAPLSIGAWGVVDLHSPEGAKGVGYWLARHRTVLAGRDGAASYEVSVRRVFRETDVAQAVVRFGVRRVLSQTPLPGGVEISQARRTQWGTLYVIRN